MVTFEVAVPETELLTATTVAENPEPTADTATPRPPANTAELPSATTMRMRKLFILRAPSGAPPCISQVITLCYVDADNDSLRGTKEAVNIALRRLADDPPSTLKRLRLNLELRMILVCPRACLDSCCLPQVACLSGAYATIRLEADRPYPGKGARRPG